jgi:hypothetical protein
MSTGEITSRGDWNIFRGGVIFMEGTQNCKIENCSFKELGGSAIFFNNFNRKDEVNGCLFENIGASAVCFCGDKNARYNVNLPFNLPFAEIDLHPGPKTNNFPANCLVYDNLMHDLGTVEKQVAGVHISMSMDIIVSHNTIYNVPRTGHECGDARYLAIPYLDACMALRLPDKNSSDQTLKLINMDEAWFGSLTDSVAVPAKEFTGDPVNAVWLPNQKVARYWEEYIKTGEVSDDTPPPPPTNVQVSDQGDLGTKITWDAEADFESGIRSFVILRNGTVFAQVAKNPYGEYGRPLFQSMSYGDTPRPDMPESKMIYVDNSSINGLNQKYSVITVNGVGLKSEPTKY